MEEAARLEALGTETAGACWGKLRVQSGWPLSGGRLLTTLLAEGTLLPHLHTVKMVALGPDPGATGRGAGGRARCSAELTLLLSVSEPNKTKGLAAPPPPWGAHLTPCFGRGQRPLPSEISGDKSALQ